MREQDARAGPSDTREICLSRTPSSTLFSSYEKEINPWSQMIDAPQPDEAENGAHDTEAPADGTLGGYLALHNRPPAFEGPDGRPYTVSLEVEKTPDLQAPFSGYLVFPRWADTGAGIVGHLETPLLLHGKSQEEVTAELGTLTLLEVYDLLRDAVSRRHEEKEPC
jgi:hypothetical protein